MLYTHPVLRDIAPGDVIIFFDPAQNRNIVHRVVKIDGDLFITQGDNNPNTDPKPIPIHEIVGKVTYVDAPGQIRQVWGGKIGLLWMKIQSTKNKLTLVFYRLFSPLYQWLKKKDILPKVWHPKIIQLSFGTSTGSVIKYIHKGRTVATWHPSTGVFHCQHPYDLIIKSPSNHLLEGKTR